MQKIKYTWLTERLKSKTVSLHKVDSGRRNFLVNGLALAGSILVGDVGIFKQKAAAVPASTLDLSSLKQVFKGEIAVPGDTNFNQFAFGTIFNQLQPTRTPQVIVRVKDEQDVVEAVKFAKRNNLKVAVRGGGHNWCSPSLRDNGMMIDLTNLNKIISIDETGRKAVVQPVISNREILKNLTPINLAYPSGHCPTVKLSGYLLSGGMSWNQGVWGHGCESVEAIELVNSDGEMITASKDQHPDYYWAARGAGPGFFGVAVRYHLKLHELPQYITATSYTYSLSDMGTVAEWLGETAKKLPANVELSLFVLEAPPQLQDKAKKHGGKICMVTASTFADSKTEAEDATKLLTTCPVLPQCLAKSENEKVDFEKLFDMSGGLWPEGLRCHVEAMFSNAKPAALFNAVEEHLIKAPSPLTVFMIAFFTGPNVPAPLPNTAFSMSSDLYGGSWTMWKKAEDDEVNTAWHKEILEKIKPYTAGYYVSETDTVAYPDHVKAAYLPGNFKRLNELREKHDPTGVFFNYHDGLS